MVTLLQDHYHVPRMEVHEVEPECATDLSPSWESTHWESYLSCYIWEEYPVGPGLIRGGEWGEGVTQIAPYHPVLGLPIGGQVT